jgi:hypothetical protein
MVLRLWRVVEYIWYEDLQCSPVRRDGGQHGLSANSNLWRDMIREREREIVRETKRVDGCHVVACFTKGVNEDK